MAKESIKKKNTSILKNKKNELWYLNQIWNSQKQKRRSPWGNLVTYKIYLNADDPWSHIYGGDV